VLWWLDPFLIREPFRLKLYFFKLLILLSKNPLKSNSGFLFKPIRMITRSIDWNDRYHLPLKTAIKHVPGASNFHEFNQNCAP
jgi:hypothetical protein